MAPDRTNRGGRAVLLIGGILTLAVVLVVAAVWLLG